MSEDRSVSWDRAYADGSPPWDIGRPQPGFETLADAGEIVGPVLDSGCGTGEQALMVAARGIDVVGIDIAPTAIKRAVAKARDRGLAVEFLVADVLALDRLGRTFATVLDSGIFHTFDDHDRPRYVASLAVVMRPGGVLHLLCFSEHTPGTIGPRRVTQAELRTAFARGWAVERITATRFAVRDGWPGDAPYAWLARIVRTTE